MTGALYLLPYIDFYQEHFSDEDDNWTEKAIQYGKRFVAAIVGVDQATRELSESTPLPIWLADDENYELPTEQRLQRKLLRIESRIESFQSEKEKLQDQIANDSILRALLFEKRNSLEIAILEALRLMGFKANPFQEKDSEFDVVFESQEGRLIGEEEGKDNKAINIEKLRQLEMNLQEDYSRDEISEFAKGALIGNAYRLTPPEERREYFTTKCVLSANRSQTALIRSVDLFEVAKYLLGKKDAKFARNVVRRFSMDSEL